MATPSLNDLRYAFYGGGTGRTLSDAEYTALLNATAAGASMAGMVANDIIGANATPPLTGAVETMSRTQVLSNANSAVSQTMRLTAFTAPRSEQIVSVRVITGTVAAAATPTIIRFGIYEVAADGAITLVASTTNDTTLLTGLNTEHTKALTTPYSLVQGRRYAFAQLVVSAAAMPTMCGSVDGLSAMTAAAKRLPWTYCTLAGQANLPASATYASLSGAAGGIGRQYACLIVG